MPDQPAASFAYYRAQAGWTRELRDHVYRRLAVGTRGRALDVGCGDGHLTAELAAKVRDTAVGCDVDAGAVAAAGAAHPELSFVVSGSEKLPFADASFDLAVCHFTLLWAADPAALLAEMRRVTRPGGAVAALAEPDWGGYLQWPNLGLRELLATALASRGADPLAGRKLPAWFTAAGMACRYGLTGGPWRGDEADLAATWDHHRWTLAGFVDERRLRVMETQARRAAADGTAVIHLPLAWAVATV